MRSTAYEGYSVREIRRRWLALKLNMQGEERAGGRNSRPPRQRRCGVSRRTPPAGLSSQRGASLEPAYACSAGESGVLLGLRKLSPPRSRISEFSTSRSAMAVAMVVLKRMLPQSENGVLVVMMVDRFWL